MTNLPETLVRLQIGTILTKSWNQRNGRVVPKDEDVTLADGAVKLQATTLYSDLANSTRLAQRFPRPVAAKIVRAFLSSMTSEVRRHGGEVRSFDGDRVMGIFIGDGKNSRAARCALRMNWVMENALRPRAEKQFPSLVSKGFHLSHCVGVAHGDVLVVRGGIRGSNDLVFIGEAPNIAAKLSELRETPYASFLAHNVYSHMSASAKFADGRSMWEPVKRKLGDDVWDCFRSHWTWGF